MNLCEAESALVCATSRSIGGHYLGHCPDCGMVVRLSSVQLGPWKDGNAVTGWTTPHARMRPVPSMRKD